MAQSVENLMEQMVKMMATQQEEMSEQRKLINTLLAAQEQNKAAKPVPIQNNNAQMDSLAKRLGMFTYDPSSGATFIRYAMTLDEAVENLSEKQQVELVLNALGEQEYDQLCGRVSPKTPSKLNYNEIMEALRELFNDPRTLFQRRYDTLNTEAINDSVEAVLDEVNLEGDLFEFENLNLDKFKLLLAALRMKAPRYQEYRAIILKHSESCTLNEVRDLIKTHKNISKDAATGVQKEEKEINKIESKIKWYCYRCGNNDHKSNACPFFKEKCNYCHRVGHIERVCLLKQKRGRETQVRAIRIQDINLEKHQNRKSFKVYINNYTVNMQADTGADMSTIGIETWKQIGKPEKKECPYKVYNADGSEIDVYGIFQAEIKYKERKTKAEILILEKETQLLSGRVLSELEIIKWTNKVTLETNWEEDYPKLFGKDNNEGGGKQIDASVQIDKELDEVILKALESTELRNKLREETNKDSVLNKVKERIDHGWKENDKMSEDVERLVRNCKQCQQVANKPIKMPLQPWPQTEKAWARIHLDFAEPEKGNAFLVVVDSFSRYVDAAWIHPATSTATIKYLRVVFRHLGPPECIVTDNGTQFTSSKFAKLCAKFDIVHLRTAPCMPQSNGLAERMVQTLKKAIDEEVNALDIAVATYNYTPSAELEGLTPSEVFFNRQLKTPLDVFKPRPKIQQNLNEKQTTMKVNFDNHHGTRIRNVEEGEDMLIEKWNGEQLKRKITKLRENTMAEIQVGDEILTRHYNQIWKTQSNPPILFQTPKSESLEKENLNNSIDEPEDDIIADDIITSSTGEKCWVRRRGRGDALTKGSRVR